MLEGLCFLREVGGEVVLSRRRVGQEHGRLLKEIWNEAQRHLEVALGP